MAHSKKTRRPKWPKVEVLIGKKVEMFSTRENLDLTLRKKVPGTKNFLYRKETKQIVNFDPFPAFLSQFWTQKIWQMEFV